MVLFSANRMRLTVLLVAVICLTETSSKVTRKSQKEQTLLTLQDEKETHSKKTQPQQKQQKAIIAIEIVDPNDNSTKLGKGRKRTIESSLGYGYQSLFNVQQKPPKYETYKYSQRDIPAGKTTYASTPLHHQSSHKPEFEIQKSVRYDLGSTKPEFIPYKQQKNLNQYYQPGTTLYSTLDQNGHIGGLSSQEPQQSHNGMVPVIILRVFTNQLTQPGALHANIPHNHPYANLNSIDLQNLLAGYVQQHSQQQNYEQPTYEQPQHQQQMYVQYEQAPQQQYEQPSHQQYEQPSHQQQYEQPSHPQQTYEQPQQVYYQQPAAVYQPQAYQYQQGYHYSQPKYQTYQQPAHNDELQTHENYPDDAHTKVIFHKEPVQKASKTKTSTKVANPTAAPQKFRITIPENTYSKVEVQEYETPQTPQEQQYYYYQPGGDQQAYYQYQDGKQYVQVSQYPQEEQQQYQQYQDGAQYAQYEQQPQSYQEQTTYEQIAPQESHDYSQHKVASDVDAKVYNYHAHGTQHAQKTRSTKKRRVRLPTKEAKSQKSE